MNKRIKKYFAAFLIVVLFFAEMRLDSFAAAMQDDDNQNTNTMFQVYETDKVNVTFQVTDSWEGGYNAVVSIENLSDQVLHNWSLDLQYAHDISSIWNAVIIAKNENGYSIKNAGWNQDIDPGMVTTFGIGAQEGFVECPSAVVLQSDEIIVANDQYEVQYAVDNDWLSEFIASLVIKNVGESPIEDWVLTFEYENEITNIWNAVIEKHLDNRYVIRNAGYNANIEARGNTTIGFIVEGESVVEPPKNIELHYIGRDFSENQEDKTSQNQEEGQNQEQSSEHGEEGNNEDTVVIDYEKDSDFDGLPDYLEEYFGTDLNKIDTDDDGLSDYDELFIVESDPSVRDSIATGIADGDADNDEDGLSNQKEIELGTNPLDADTDGDDLSDYEEISNHNTNPSNVDTDEDGLYDGTELTIGLNPNEKDTDLNGICDGLEVLKRRIDVDRKKLFADNDTIPIVEITGKGEYRNSLHASTLDEHAMFRDLNYIVGDAYLFQHADDFDFDKCTLTFKLSDKVLKEANITDLVIACFDEENGCFKLLETQYNEAEQIIYADVEHFSIYAVINRNVFYQTYLYAIKIMNQAQNLDFAENVQKFGGHFYKRFDLSMPWMDAVDYCANLGGHLVTINSEAEQKFLNGLIKQGKKNTYWLGLFGDDNHFSWITGEKLSDYQNWAVREPSDKNETAVHMYANNRYGVGIGNWNDTFNSFYDPRDYWSYANCGLICEWEEMPEQLEDNRTIALTTGQVVKLLKNPLLGDIEIDTDDDKVPDLKELSGLVKVSVSSPYSEVLNEPEKTQVVELWKAISIPTEPDTDGDYYLDNVDTNLFIWDATELKDCVINDSKSAYGENPSYSSEDRANGNITQADMGDGTMKKNEYVFTRTDDSKHTHEGYSATFTITPDTDSYYEVIVEDVKDARDVFYEVTYDEKGTRFHPSHRDVRVEALEIVYENGRFVFKFYFEKGQGREYTICLDNYSDSPYHVRVSQDNWAYAPEGGIQKAISWNLLSYLDPQSMISEKLYITGPQLASVLADISGGATTIIDTEMDLETQARNILTIGRGEYVGDEEMVGTLVTVAITATVEGFALGKRIGEFASVFIFKDPVGAVLNVYTVTTGLPTIDAWLQQKDFEEAYMEGRTNVVLCDLVGDKKNYWEAWKSAPYISKRVMDFTMSSTTVPCITTQKIKEKIRW